jgi:hypothetical protein
MELKDINLMPFGVLCKIEAEVTPTKSSIIRLKTYVKNTGRAKEDIPTEYGRMTTLEILKVGSKIENVKVGQFVAMNATAVSVKDNMLSAQLGYDVAMISGTNIPYSFDKKPVAL